MIPSEDTKSKCENVAEVRYENNGINAFGIPNGYVLSHQYFSAVQNPGRLLASLLYSAILTIPNPINGNDKLWLSSYNEDDKVEQPKKHWRKESSGNQQQNIQQQLLEFSGESIKKHKDKAEIAWK